MKITFKFKTELKTDELTILMLEASRAGLRDTIVDIHEDTILNAKSVGFWLTGHNARSIASEVSGMGIVQRGQDAEPEKVVDDRLLQAAVYSTSGYGGYGEVGTSKMAARPYFRPAYDKNIGGLARNIRDHIKD